MPCTNITLLFGMIPPPKKSKKELMMLTQSPEPKEEEQEEGEEGGDPKPADPEAEPEPEPEPEPELKPRRVLLNSNVPCAILLHHARKCYLKEEKVAITQELPISMETPCAQLDFAKEDGTVVGLGDEEGLKEVASEKLEERTEYILVKREENEEGEVKFVSLCPKFAEVEFKQ